MLTGHRNNDSLIIGWDNESNENLDPSKMAHYIMLPHMYIYTPEYNNYGSYIFFSNTVAFLFSLMTSAMELGKFMSSLAVTFFSTIERFSS